ncbi:MAG: rubrerythrin family protein [Cyanobacteria bacterium RUI128]|nr:rubrerythrin family protein [Cyanobacteria bacterium RUI128]
MKNLKGTKTEQNLINAFRGESEARNKYTFFASKAKKEGFVRISKIFEETANNEKEHAKIWFKLINQIGSTEENLQISVDAEGYEAEEMYPEFAKTAREEGFEDIAKLFENIATVETEHGKRYKKLLSNLKNDEEFVSDKQEQWICLNCGYIHNGKDAPEICPLCSHKREYFTRKQENY